MVTCFRKDWNLSVVLAQEHEIVGISEVKCINVRINLSPWVALHGLLKSPAENVVDWVRRQCTSLSNVRVNPNSLMGIPFAAIIRQRQPLSKESYAQSKSTKGERWFTGSSNANLMSDAGCAFGQCILVLSGWGA